MKPIILVFFLLSSIQFLQAQCPNDNTFWEAVNAPVNLNGLVTTQLYAGEYTRVNSMQAGHTYEITTCGNNDFDTEITIYKQGSSTPDAFNDDFDACGTQTKVYFTPFSSGNYDIVLNQYPCNDNSANYTDVDVRLIKEPADVVSIPVVVHVIYNNAQENISNNQVLSQIDVLNEDFRRLNNDLQNIPSRFKGFSGDTRIEFCLASKDPEGNPTTGITRTQTNVTQFAANNAMKFSNNGGHDAWPRNQYLNIWVCDIENGLLGYAQFPGENAATDGVVVGYRFFGRTGLLTAPFNQGRTCTHEVGHWLGLRHIWGDGNCSVDDNINDTPIQGAANYDCPVDPTSCSNAGLGGDMSVNYMDYVDDACMSMFTYQQGNLVRGTLNGSRSSLNSSDGCTTNDSPVAGFQADRITGYAPLTVNFADLTTGDPTDWDWTFNGAQPAASTQQNPSGIIYQDTGWFTVSLSVENAWGSDDLTNFDYIHVIKEPDPIPPAGVVDLGVHALLVFPNPVTVGNRVNITANKPIDKLVLKDAVGRELLVDYPSNHGELLTDQLSAGNYSLLIDVGGETQMRTLIVQ